MTISQKEINEEVKNQNEKGFDKIKSSYEISKTHPFNFHPFQEDVLIVGGKGKGKTELTKEILREIPNLPTWINDYSNRFDSEFGTIVNDVSQLDYGQFVLRAKDKTKIMYAQYCEKAFHTQYDLVVCHDELHQYTTKNEIFRPLYELVLSGRNRGLSNIFVTTRTASVPNYILSNLSHLFVKKLHLASDIDWLSDYIGDLAYLLIPKDKRRKGIFTEKNDIDILPDDSYIYRNMNDSKSYLVIRSERNW